MLAGNQKEKHHNEKLGFYQHTTTKTNKKNQYRHLNLTLLRLSKHANYSDNSSNYLA